MSGENELNIEDISIDNLALGDDAVLSGGVDPLDQLESVEPVKVDDSTEQPVDTTTEEPTNDGTEGTEGDEESEDIQLDEDENIVDENGNVLYKKGEYEVVTDEDGNQSIEVNDSNGVDAIRQIVNNEYGIEFGDTENPKEYANTNEGLSEMIKDAASFIAKKNEETVYGDFPIAKDFLNHVMAGQDPRNFFEVSTNYRDIVIPEETNDNKGKLGSMYKNLIVENIRERYGYAQATNEQKVTIDKEAESFYEFKKNGGTEREAAFDAQNMLSSIERSKEQQRNLKNQQILQARQEQDTLHWNRIKDVVIEKGQVGQINIPKNDREAFFNYMSADADGQGHTQEYLDAVNMDSQEMNLQLAYMRYLKFDVDKLVQSRVAQSKAKELKLLASKKRIKLSGRVPIEKRSNDISQISIDNIIDSNR